MTQISHQEAGKILDESLKKAASCARELEKIQKNKLWGVVAIGLDRARENGQKLVTAKALSRIAILQSVGEHTDKKKPSAH